MVEGHAMLVVTALVSVRDVQRGPMAQVNGVVVPTEEEEDTPSFPAGMVKAKVSSPPASTETDASLTVA